MSTANCPNILVIMTDQHHRDFMGCAGNRIVRTPNLDRLAGQGVRFTDAYCPAPLCVPSRMSFLTGLTPSHNQVWDNHHILSSNIPTWATVLTAAGYDTALLGRMHFCGPDQRHGFLSRPVGESNAGHPGAPGKGGPAWAQFSGWTAGQCREAVEVAGRGPTHYQWADAERTRVTVDWLRARAAAGTGGNAPFAAVLGYVLPHCPFIAPKDLFDYYYERVDLPTVESSLPESIRRWRQSRGITKPEINSEHIRIARAAYYGLCEYTDSLIGQVLDALETGGLADNTLVIYTSDHGEMAGEHGCWWKSTYYEGSVSVPLLARWPGRIPPGTLNPAVCNLLDIGPTVVEAADSTMPYATDGHSLLTTMATGTDRAFPETTFSELVDMHTPEAIPSRMIRSGPWKYWEYAGVDAPPPSLFNLENDRAELYDLASNPAHAGVRQRLQAELRKNWNPEWARERSIEMCKHFMVLHAWGRQVQPDSPDELPLPPADYEAAVELL